LNKIRAFFRIVKNIGILEKDPNKMEIETEIDDYEENFDSKLT